MFNKLLSFCKIHNLMVDLPLGLLAPGAEKPGYATAPMRHPGRIRRFDGWRVAVVDWEGSCPATNRDVQNIAGLTTPGGAPAWLFVFGQGSTKVQLSCACPHHEGIWGSYSFFASALDGRNGQIHGPGRGPCFECPEVTHSRCNVQILCIRHPTPGMSNWGSPEGHMGHICVVMRATHDN